MNIKKILASIILTTVPSLHYAINPTPGVYGGLIVGGSYQLGIDAPFLGPFANTVVSSTNPYAAELQALINQNKNNLNYKLNYSFLGLLGGQLGYRWNKCRLEAQFLYNTAPYSDLVLSNQQSSYTISSNDTATSYITGNTYTMAFMFNAYLDLLPPDYVDSNIAPFVGIGGGYASVQNNFQFYYNGTNAVQYDYGRTQSAGAGQVMAGILYFLDDFSNFGLDFRFFSTTNLTANLPYSTNSYNAQFASVNLTFNGAFNLG
jgi:hypothetical protein